MAHTQRIIFDTDIGTDVDDCLALALILCSPELQLEGVTYVYGDVDLRARAW
jgi:purine nucleosidase